MRKYVYLYCIMYLAFIACRPTDWGNGIDVGQTKLALTINSLNNHLLSRAVSSDEEEKMIYNLFVYVFNQDGSKSFSQRYDNINTSSSTQLQIKDISCGTGKTVVVIANMDNTVSGISEDELTNITFLNQLSDLVTTMKGDLIERGNSFLMSGIAGNVALVADKNNLVELKLFRVDSKVRFHITTAEGVTFTPQDWRVCSIPKKVTVLPKEADDKFAAHGDYFDTAWSNFEVSTNPDQQTFAFYTLENRVTYKKQIADYGDYHSQYALREKRIKEDHGDGTITNGAFEYASDAATYVEIRGNVRYRPNADTEVSADVVYTVHLGSVAGVNDYYSLRNTSYTYNVRIVSVGKIIIEVESETGEEPRPGSEGNVVIAKEIKEIDACNDVFRLVFHQSDIDNTLTWNVYTPFSTGSEIDNPTDFDWIYFSLCNESGGFYTDDLVEYLGDPNVYADADFYNENMLDHYMADIASHKNKMLTIRQLVAILKECKTRFVNNERMHLFDSSDKISFTAYVKDYYYEKNPNIPSEKVENGLWKKFVNQKMRVLNILSNLKYSADGNSSKSNALYSIRQASIQTMYNQYATENFTAWGSQMIQDEEMLAFDSQDYPIWDNSHERYNDKHNGRKNSINMWISSSKKWSDYVDIKTWRMQSNYDYAKYKCLRMNRDNNGNGVVDASEIQWYLASINQLTDMWIGENSYSNDARLYKLSIWNQKAQWYASSTVIDRIRIGINQYRDNPLILWASEGSSVGKLDDPGINEKVYYRCVRNLGFNQNESETSVPDDFVNFDTDTNIINLDRLDKKSIRGFSTEEELSDHTERDVRGYNKPWQKLEVSRQNVGGDFTWEQIRQRSQPNGTNPVCPKGWRVPNQRELALMYSRMPSDIWTLDNHFSRTSFSFGNSTRPGFSVSKSGSVYYLLNTGLEKGGVRCVRDVI